MGLLARIRSLGDGAKIGFEQVFYLEPETGVEPATCCLQDSCSAELSYSGGMERNLARNTARLVLNIDEATWAGCSAGWNDWSGPLDGGLG